MAISHIQLGQTPASARVRAMVLGLEANSAALVDEVATMQTMIDGDGSDPAMYDNVVTLYGIVGTPQTTANQFAQSLFFELESLMGKITTDNTVDHVNAAIQQAANKIR